MKIYNVQFYRIFLDFILIFFGFFQIYFLIKKSQKGVYYSHGTREPDVTRRTQVAIGLAFDGPKGIVGLG